MLSSGLLLPHEHFVFKIFCCSRTFSLFPSFNFFYLLQMHHILVYSITGLYLERV